MPSDPYRWVDHELRQLDAQHLRRSRRVRQSPQAAAIRLDGRDLLNFGSNDYLGIAAELATASRIGDSWGSGASPMVTGRSEEHRLLENELAELEHAATALLFSSGYAANVGTITALVGKGDIIFSDQKNHASIIDGCRLSGARIVIYSHADVSALQRAFEANEAHVYRRRLIVTDTLFSMDGDLAPLASLAQLAEDHDAMLLVDEAHATGVFGPRGSGLVEELQLENAIPVRVGTLSKALGSVGGFTVGPQAILEWIAHAARSYFFSTAPPDVFATAAREALRIVREQPQRRCQLLENAATLRQRLLAIGCHIGHSRSQIVPVILGDATRTIDCAARLLDLGLFVPGIRPPSVPAGESLLRISLSYRHTPEHLERLVAALADVLHRG